MCTSNGSYGIMLHRAFLGTGSGPAQWPNASRLVEAICIRLCALIPSPVRTEGRTMTRWASIMAEYNAIRDLVLASPRVMRETEIQLFLLNQKTLIHW